MKKKILSILLISILSLTLIGCGNNNTKNNKKEIELKEDWEEKYAEYISEEHSLFKDQKDFEIAFIKIDAIKKPVMVLLGQGSDAEGDSPDGAIATLYLDENSEYKYSMARFNDFDLKLLYNIEKEKYEWVFYRELKDGKIDIRIIDSFVEDSYGSDVMKIFTKSEFEKKYVLIDDVTKAKIEDASKAKDIVYNLVEEKEVNQVTDKIKEETDKKVEEVKEKIKEEESKVITAGKYTLKYGYYKNTNTISAPGLDITINSDNTCTYQIAGQKLYDTDTCTFEIKKYSGKEFDGSYVSGYHIIFHITGQSDKYYNINKNNTFIDQSAELKYQGSEKN